MGRWRSRYPRERNHRIYSELSEKVLVSDDFLIKKEIFLFVFRSVYQIHSLQRKRNYERSYKRATRNRIKFFLFVSFIF